MNRPINRRLTDESNALKGIELNPFTSLENEVISNEKRHESNALKGILFL